MTKFITVCALALSTPRAAAFAPTGVAKSSASSVLFSTEPDNHWMDYLKFDKEPTFDVLEMSKKYSACNTYSEIESFRSDDFLFRGSVIGPITNNDLRLAQEGFDYVSAYPDFKREIFGHSIDPQNPYRCFYFERWTGTNTGSLKLGPTTLPPTNNRVEIPIHVSSVTWNPEGKVVYEVISPPVDRFEGNTKGAGAVLGLLAGGGVEQGPSGVGATMLIIQQKILQKLGIFGKQWSEDKDIPSWWKSKARGADPNDI